VARSFVSQKARQPESGKGNSAQEHYQGAQTGGGQGDLLKKPFGGGKKGKDLPSLPSEHCTS